MTRRHHHLAAYTLSALLALTAASCGGDDDTDPPATTEVTPAPTTTTPPTTLSPEAEIEAAFEEFVDVLRDQAVEPNPDDERLDEVMVDPLLARIRTSVSERSAANHVYEISPDSRSEVISVSAHSDGTASAVVCTVGADRLIDRDTGEQVRESTVSTLRDEVSFTLEGGRWMLSDYTTTDSWDGIRSCES